MNVYTMEKERIAVAEKAAEAAAERERIAIAETQVRVLVHLPKQMQQNIEQWNIEQRNKRGRGLH